MFTTSALTLRCSSSTPSPLFSNECVNGRTFTKVPWVKISIMSTFLCLTLSFKQDRSAHVCTCSSPPFRSPSSPHIDTRHLDPLCEESPFNSSKTETEQEQPRNSMPRRQLTHGTWAESHGQRYILHIPGLLRVWRPEPDFSSRRDPARDPPSARRRPSLRGPRRSDIDGLYDHQDFSSDHDGGLTYQAASRLNRPSPFDSWEHLRDTLPSNGGDYHYRRGSASQPYGSLQSLHEVRQPSWVREGGGSPGYYPSTSSRFTNMRSRRKTRRHFDADDDYRHQSRFTAAQPPRGSEYLYSHTASSRGTSAPRDSGQDPNTADRPRYEDSQGRPFDNNGAPPFMPNPLSARYGNADSFRSSSGRDRYTSYGGYRGRDDDDGFSDDEGYSSSEDWP
jgi:hypothetical protein